MLGTKRTKSIIWKSAHKTNINRIEISKTFSNGFRVQKKTRFPPQLLRGDVGKTTRVPFCGACIGLQAKATEHPEFIKKSFFYSRHSKFQNWVGNDGCCVYRPLCDPHSPFSTPPNNSSLWRPGNYNYGSDHGLWRRSWWFFSKTYYFLSSSPNSNNTESKPRKSEGSSCLRQCEWLIAPHKESKSEDEQSINSNCRIFSSFSWFKKRRGVGSVN